MKKAKIEKLYKKLERKFDRIFRKHSFFNLSIQEFGWNPQLWLKDKYGNKIIVKLEKETN